MFEERRRRDSWWDGLGKEAGGWSEEDARCGGRWEEGRSAVMTYAGVFVERIQSDCGGDSAGSSCTAC